MCLIIFYVFATPLNSLFTFHFNLGLLGLLYGCGIAAIMLLISYFMLLMCSDWNKIAAEVIEEHKGPSEEKEEGDYEERISLLGSKEDK
jgi:hypothetical protein